MTDCRIRIYGDQTQCATCGLAWDTNDPEPPACPGQRAANETPRQYGQRVLDGLKKLLSDC